MNAATTSNSSAGPPRVFVRGRATQITVATLGVLASLTAAEHGIGELRQGSIGPESLVIQSWPDTPSFATLNGEPALTVIPNMLFSGILTLLVAAAAAVWSVGFAHKRHGGPGLGGLALLLLLVGGGFGPPVLFGVLSVAAALSARPARRPIGRFREWLGRGWPVLLAITVAGYLGLVPGTVLLHRYAGVDSLALVSVLIAVAFSGLALALIAAHSRDHTTATTNGAQP